jgi:TRAP-type C4-dicarboxylate transport system permease small subunit
MNNAGSTAPVWLHMARRLRQGVAALAAVMAHIAGWNYILCACFITFDIVARSFFGFSSKATVEVTGYMLAGGIAWALAHTLARRAHIRVDVFMMRLPLGLRAWLHLFPLTLLLGLGIFFAWAALELVDESALFNAHDNSALRIEMIWPQGIWAFGIISFAIMGLVLMLEASLAILAGKPEELDRLLGSRSLQDETAEALEAVGMAHEAPRPQS